MKHVADVTTDCATVCFFDPCALPVDFAEQQDADFLGSVRRISDAGLLWFAESDADGLYRIEFYVEETPAANALRDAVPLPWKPKFKIPSGIVCVAPIEGIYGASDMDELPTKQSLPVEWFGRDCVFCVEPGCFEVISWSIDYSEETRYDPNIASTKYGPQYLVCMKRRTE